MEFAKPSQVIRHIARVGQYGQKRATYGVIILGGYSDWYWSHVTGCDLPMWDRAAALNARHRRFVHYCREVAPQWRTVGKRYYADNSVELVQEDRDGNRRQVMDKPPSGDASY